MTNKTASLVETAAKLGVVALLLNEIRDKVDCPTNVYQELIDMSNRCVQLRLDQLRKAGVRV